MKRFKLIIANGLCLVASALTVLAEPLVDLNGATGKVFKVDTEAQSFELLKETEYDPKTDISKSRFTVFWKDSTVVTRAKEIQTFADVEGPVMAKFYGIDEAGTKALAAGQAFEARVAEIHAGVDSLEPSADDRFSVIGRFTPERKSGVHHGVIEVDGKKVPVSMRKRHWKIRYYEPVEASVLADGFWKATLSGAEEKGKFMINRMEVTSFPDPRAMDVASLPRVLVIGDSISMNYQKAAINALDGTVNYHRNDGNAFSSVHGASNAELWLGNYQEEGLHWDVIQFNHGLHDLKQSYDKDTDTFGDYAVSLELYKESLEKEISILKRTGATLIWASTTPVPQDIKTQYARRKGVPAIFNQAALEVMQNHPEILINDLHSVVENSPVYDEWREGFDPHFYSYEEQRLLGEAVAGAVLRALLRRLEGLE